MNLNSILGELDFAQSCPAAALRARPLGFVDVGARGGVHDIVAPVAGVTAVLGFEPDQEECARLRTELSQHNPWARCEMEPTALGESDENAKLYLLSAPTNHSLRPPNEELTRRYQMVKWQMTGSVPLQTRCLDAILFGPRAAETSWGEFLKLDTQGTEYEVLTGARRTLAERTVAIICEVEFFQIYRGQRLFSEVELLLRQQGFSFYGFQALHHRSCRQLDKRVHAGQERAFHADAIFFKDPFAGGPFQGTFTQRQWHVAFVCAVLTGFYDFALELALQSWASGAEAERLQRLVKHLAQRPAAQSRDEVLSLADRVRACPENANVELGRFVDRFREYPDYHDTPLERSA